MTNLILNLVPGALILIALYLASGRKEPSREYVQFQGQARQIIVIERKHHD